MSNQNLRVKKLEDNILYEDRLIPKTDINRKFFEIYPRLTVGQLKAFLKESFGDLN